MYISRSNSIVSKKYAANIAVSEKKYLSGNLLVFLLIGISGIPFFIQDNTFLAAAFVLSFIVFKYSKKRIDNYYTAVIGILVIVSVGQIYTFGIVEYEKIVSLIIRFSIPYFIIKILGAKFLYHYIRVLYFLSIISLILFIPTLLSYQLFELLSNFVQTLSVESYDWKGSVIFYTIIYGVVRNAGPFWEPGAFCCFLILGLIFNIIVFKKLNTKYSVIFILSIISTFSSAGYITLIFVLSSYFMILYKKKEKFIIAPLLLVIVFYAFYSVEFLGKKIEEQFDTQVNTIERLNNLGRFQSAILDYKDITEYPFFGRGRGETRFHENEFFKEYGVARRSNGITDLIAKMGIPFFIFYLISVYVSLRVLLKSTGLNTKIAIAFIISILMVGFSQLIFTYPLFAGLIFMKYGGN